MDSFSGFSQRDFIAKIPGQFFSELLPQIDHLPELKVTLYCFWRIQQKEGGVAYLRLREMLADRAFLDGLAPRDDERRAALEEGLERATARGTLLHVELHGEDWQEDLYFVNTPRGQAAVAGIEEGTWSPAVDPAAPLEVLVERPNIFTLYEQNIGPMTPMIAERLRDLEEAFSEAWIVEAFEIAVARNVRKLAYIEGVLNRWQNEGRDDPDWLKQDGERFIRGKYGDEIEY